MEGVNADRAAAMSALRRLGIEPGDREIPIARLAGGLSGASVWGIEVDGRAMVLKLTPAGVDGAAWKRAERERRFYRELAAQVPLRVPEMIGQVSSPGDGTALLLVAYPEAPPLAGWTLADYEQVARDLGEFHGTFWGCAPADLPGWLPSQDAVSPEMAAEASALWAEITVKDDLLPLRRVAERLALEMPRFDRERERLPLTLCHGDAHWGNLLRGVTGGWVWADWQGVRLGEGVNDLVFFWQRAFAETGSVPPMEHLLGTYVEGLSQAGASPVTEDVLGRAVGWFDLELWLIAWPPYLGWLEPEVRERVLRRIENLLAALEIDVD